MARPRNLKEGLPRLWRVLRHFAPRLRGESPLVAGSLLALLAGVAFRLLEPWPIKFVLDYVLADLSPGESSYFHRLSSLDPYTLLACAAAAVVVIALLRAAVEYQQRVGFALLGNRVLTRVRNDLYRHLNGLSLSYFSKARGGDLIVRVTGDVNMLKDVASTAILPLIASVLILIGMFAVMCWMHWKLALLALIVLPLFALTTVRLTRRIHGAARKQRQREAALAATASESITAIALVQALSLETIFGGSFDSSAQKSQKEGVRTSRLQARLERTVDVLTAIGSAMVLWYGARLVLTHELTPGDLIVFLTYLKRAFRPLQDFAKYSGRLAKAAAAGERVIDVLNTQPDVQERPDAVAAPPLTGAIRLDNVHFAYEDGAAVFNGVNLDIAAGERVAVVGPSGIGKSTLLSLLLRLRDVDAGRVLIDGRDIREFTLASLRSQISIVLQDNLLFATTLRDNIAYGRAGCSDADVHAAAQAANADGFISRLTKGFDTVVGERGVTLSHGQRQRVALARAIVRDAPILLLDEPHTGLDRRSEQAVSEAMDQAARGKTTLLVTHDLVHAAQCDRIYYLAEGRIAESGTHDELLRLDGLYARVYRLQISQSASSQETVSHVAVS